MSKGPRIKPIVRRTIVGEARDARNKNKPRRQLMVELQTIIERMGEIVPSEETLEKLISWARNHPKSPLDEQFSLASLAEYHIPPEAVPVIVWVYRKRLREEETHFTIRQALWIARLHTFFNPATDVDDWAFVYALREELCEILGEPFFTRDLDMKMMNRGKGQTTLGRNLYRYYPLPPPSPFPFGEQDEWEQRLREKGYRVE